MENMELVEVKEKMTVKEFMKKYRSEIIAGVAVTGAVVACAVISKKYQRKLDEITSLISEKASEINALKENNNRMVDAVTSVQNMNDHLMVDNDVLSAIVSEGVIQDAITATKDKIANREKIKAQLEKKLKKAPEDTEALEKITQIMDEIGILTDRLCLCEEKQEIFEIKDTK